MDRLIYTALSGAKAAMARQEVAANNLANVSTAGFRAETRAYQAVPINGAPARVFSLDEAMGADMSPGPVQQTGRDLDIAVEGNGWFAVEGGDGAEAYTRGGSLKVDNDGTLRTASGRAVMSDGGQISIPANTRVSIGSDGTVTATGSGKGAVAATVGRIKLVHPADKELQRGDDGLFRMRDGSTAPVDAGVRVAAGSLEGSNVNPVESMVTMIALARQFDLHMKMLSGEEGNSRASAQLLNVSS